jgi:chaperonin GroEL (HSP60 family)
VCIRQTAVLDPPNEIHEAVNTGLALGTDQRQQLLHHVAGLGIREVDRPGAGGHAYNMRGQKAGGGKIISSSLNNTPKRLGAGAADAIGFHDGSNG